MQVLEGTGRIGRLTARILLSTAIAVAAAATAGFIRAAGAGEPPAPGTARYRLRLMSESPPRLAVTALLPVEGQALEMDSTRPSVIDDLGGRGWPGLIRGLRAKDAAGRPVRLAEAGPAAWRLEAALAGSITLEYEVDYSPLAARGWPAPREAAFSGPEQIVLVGRSLFITTPRTGRCLVEFDLPRGWRPVTPWVASPAAQREFLVPSAKELVENLLVLSRTEPETATASGFSLRIVPMGPWRGQEREIRRVLGSVIRRFVEIMRFDGHESYLVVLLPVPERGGESYRDSFALTLDVPPSPENLPDWANTIAHEIFHYWNGWRLQGADYPTSQWFQEGFTEYVANLSLVTGGGIDAGAFLRKLTDHVRDYRNLAGTLEAGGSRKGPPLYAGGALAAFCWDVLIRQATGGRRSLGDFLRALWERNGRGERPYDWSDIRAALDRTAPLDWEAFYRAHIRGAEPLPLEEVFPLVGLRLRRAAGGLETVETDPSSPAPAGARWKALLEGR